MKKTGAVIFCDFMKRPFGQLLFAFILFMLASNSVLSQQSSEYIVSGIDPSCFGSTDGSIRAIFTDPDASDKKYELYKKGTLVATNATMSNQIFKDLPADSFTVKMYSYIASSTSWILFHSQDIVLNTPELLVATGFPEDVNCKGVKDGVIDLTVTGGKEPYDITWSNGKKTEDLSGLAPGNYIVFVSDVRGCTTDKSFSIAEPSTAISIVRQFENSDCTNKTGSINIVTSGGTPPYKYSWSNGETTEDITKLGSGTYTVIATDNNDCAITDSITLTAPVNAMKATTVTTPISCHGDADGTATVNIEKGKLPYTIVWSDGNSSSSITGLGAGTYSVTVSDADNCTSTSTAILVEPTAMTIGKQVKNVSCKDDANGAIDVTVAGGTPSYTYSWSNGSTAQNIKNLGIGSYSLKVTDSRFCRDSFSVTITQPEVLKASITGKDLTCKGANSGSADLTVTGGTPPYSYLWNPNGATTEDIKDLSASTYMVFVTDSNECLAAGKVTLSQPADFLTITPNITPVRCQGENNGDITLSVSGGSSPYSYVWNQNSTATDKLIGLNSGLYSVAVTDGNNCRITRDIFVMEPAILKVEFTASIGCTGQDGEIDLFPSGGTEPYAFEWSNGAVVEDLENLMPGVYSVTVKDFRACSYKDSVEIKEEAQQCINIPNGFTPNNDGVNDAWVLRNIESFPGCIVDVFDRDGNGVFNSKGYAIAWDGTLNGAQLPLGTYYYVINLNSGDKQLSGTVTIVR